MCLSGLFLYENIFDNILCPFSYPLNFNMFSFFSLLGCSVFVFKNLFLVYFHSSPCLMFQEEQYAKWMAAFRLASKGKTMADSSYESEVQSITAFLSMQHPTHSPQLDPNQLNFNPDDFVSSRYAKKLKSKQVQELIIVKYYGNWLLKYKAVCLPKHVVPSKVSKFQHLNTIFSLAIEGISRLSCIYVPGQKVIPCVIIRP